MRKAVLQKISNFHRKVAGLQLYLKSLQHRCFSSEYCKIFKNTYSSLPNRRAARNKPGGGEDEPFLISVVPGISMVV